MTSPIYRLEIHEVRPEAAVLFNVAYATTVEKLETYKSYSMSISATGVLQYSDIREVRATNSLHQQIQSHRGLLILQERHDGDLGTIGAPDEFNNQEPFWYKNNVEENTSSADIITLPNNQEPIMSKTNTPTPNNNAVDNDAVNAAVNAAAHTITEAAKTLQVQVVAAEPEVTVMQRVKNAATSPTAKTLGLILGSALAGALGGLAAVEARNRGYFAKKTPQA